MPSVPGNVALTTFNMLKINQGSSVIQSAFRLHTMLSTMDETVRDYIFEQVREAEIELAIQQAVNKQLDAELQADIYRDHKNGTAGSLLYQKLPPEIRHQIYAHVVDSEQSIHVFPPKGNESHGYRLSLCDETSYDFELGNCRCDDGRYRSNPVRSDFFNNALFLVSQTVRREALDAFFMTNKFTFTCLYELTRFTAKFKQSSSKIQRLRLFERVDDYPDSEYRITGVQNARRRLKALKLLEVHVFISNWSAYERLYEDGLVCQLLHFALGPDPKKKEKEEEKERQRQAARKRKYAEFAADAPAFLGLDVATSSQLQNTGLDETTLPADRVLVRTSGPRAEFTVPFKSPPFTGTAIHHESTKAYPNFPIPPLRTFTPHVRVRNQLFSFRTNRADDPKAEYYAGLCKRLNEHLTEVFMDCGQKYGCIEDVPKLMEKPRTKTREEDKPLMGAEKRGLLFMDD